MVESSTRMGWLLHKLVYLCFFLFFGRLRSVWGEGGVQGTARGTRWRSPQGRPLGDPPGPWWVLIGAGPESWHPSIPFRHRCQTRWLGELVVAAGIAQPHEPVQPSEPVQPVIQSAGEGGSVNGVLVHPQIGTKSTSNLFQICSNSAPNQSQIDPKSTPRNP